MRSPWSRTWGIFIDRQEAPLERQLVRSSLHLPGFPILVFAKFAVHFTMRKSIAGVLIVFVVSSAALDSCVSHDFPEYVCDQEYTFAEHIRPIIESKCAISGCHNGDLGAEFNWTDFEEFHKRAERGLVKYRVTRRIMPPSFSPAGPLTQEQINAIACWSDAGALNN